MLDPRLLLWVLINQGDCSWESEIANESLRPEGGTLTRKGRQGRMRKEVGGLLGGLIVPACIAFPQLCAPPPLWSLLDGTKAMWLMGRRPRTLASVCWHTETFVSS